MNCPKCQGTMSSKVITYQGKPKSIFECDQANGECLNDKGYPNSVWPKGGAKSSAPTRSAPKSSNGNDDRSNRIERQHSQEMAIRYAAYSGLKLKTDELRSLIDWFQRDIGRLPEKQQEVGEPHQNENPVVPDEPDF